MELYLASPSETVLVQILSFPHVFVMKMNNTIEKILFMICSVVTVTVQRNVYKRKVDWCKVSLIELHCDNEVGSALK